MVSIYIVERKQNGSVVNNFTLIENTVEKQDHRITLPMVEQYMLPDDQGLRNHIHLLGKW